MRSLLTPNWTRGRAYACGVLALIAVALAPQLASATKIESIKTPAGIEVWLVPIAGTRLVVPFRITIPTPLGLGVLQATQFVSIAAPQRTGMPKTQ